VGVTLPGPEAWPTENPVADPSVDLLRQRADATPDATALVDAAAAVDADASSDAETAWTYGEFDERVAATAARLDAVLDEASADSRVGLLFGTRPAFARLYFAIQRLGATAVPLNLALDTPTLRSQATRAALDCLVCADDTAGLAPKVAPSGTPVVSVDPVSADSIRSLADVPGSGASSGRERLLDDDAVVMFTSGTTGRPKGVRLTRRNLVASAVGSAVRLGVEPGDRWLVPLPTYHMGGLAPLVRSTLYGTTAVLQREFDADSTAAVMDEFGITCVSLVPTMLTRLLDAGWTPPHSLRFVLLGGAPAPPDLLARALDRGVPVCPTYGLTETASQVATATPEDVTTDPETVGRPLRCTEVAVLDDGGDPVETGEVGELVVDGPTVTPGYLDGEHTRDAFGPAGLHTGDLGRADEDGRLRIEGRADDRIITGGENVAPERVAAALRDHPAVADVAVVGLPDEEWGERVAALVAVEGGDAAEAVSAEELHASVRDDLADFAVPKTIAIADSLPRTASGTVDREAVVARLETVSE